jgi:ATP-binding cassette, subfamily C (CFTR/MRP), member 1
LGVVGAIFVLIRNVSFNFTGLYAATRLHNSMLERIMLAPMKFFDSTPLGRIVSRFSKDQEVADSQIIGMIQSFLQTLFNVIATFFIIAYVNIWFLVPLIPILIVYVIIQQIYRRTSRELRRIDSISRSPLYSHFSETLNGLSTIRAYHRQISFIQTNFNKIDTNQRANYPQLAVQRFTLFLTF